MLSNANEAATASPSLSKDARFKLGDGRTIPCVGFGTYQIQQEVCAPIVSGALGLGYPHIDTAEIYGNEAACGEALAASGIPRENVFLTTKLWPGWGSPDQSKNRESTVASCRESLRKLGVEQVDLYLIHAPLGGGKEGRLAQYEGLVECQRLGLCASIGVSNFGIAHLTEIEDAGLPPPAANQLELHPYCQKRELLAYMARKQILPIAYSSLAPLSNWREGQQSGKSDASRAVPSPIIAIAARQEGRGKSEAACLLRYALQKGWPILPKSMSQTRAEANLDLFSFELSAEDMAEMDAMDRDETMAWPDGMDPCKVP